jgi:hypothetical protein
MEEGLIKPLLHEYGVPRHFHIGAVGHGQETSEEDDCLHVRQCTGRIIKVRAVVI